MCRPAWCLLPRRASCLLLRERSSGRPARLVSPPPPTLSLGRRRRAKAGRIASTELPYRIPRAMTQNARAGSISPDGPGAILSNSPRSPITFFIPLVPLAGAGGSSISTLSSERFLPRRSCSSSVPFRHRLRADFSVSATIIGFAGSFPACIRLWSWLAAVSNGEKAALHAKFPSHVDQHKPTASNMGI